MDYPASRGVQGVQTSLPVEGAAVVGDGVAVVGAGRDAVCVPRGQVMKN